MKEITVKLFTYSELSDKAKERARDWYNDVNDFTFEWESLKEDANTIGLELKSWGYRRYLKAELNTTPEDICKAIIANHGKTCATYATAVRFLAEFEKLLPLYESGDSSYDDKYEDLKTDFLHDISEDYRILADRQYDHTQSEEYIADIMEANEYTFLENGQRFG